MKGYYKNWYQHYLEVEQEKEKEMQRGYYSNLVEKKDMPSKREKVVHVAHVKGNHHEIKTFPRGTGGSKEKHKFRLTSFLLPVMTILGFIFLWYQMDVGPVRSLIHDVMVFSGINEEVDDVLSYHTSLLNMHTEFAQQVTAYVAGEEEADFETLELLYDEIHAQHIEVAGAKGDEYREANVLWPSMLYSTSEIMRRLATSDNVDVGYEQFIVDQEEVGTLIRNALGLNTEFQ